MEHYDTFTDFKRRKSSTQAAESSSKFYDLASNSNTLQRKVIGTSVEGTAFLTINDNTLDENTMKEEKISRENVKS